MLYKYCTTNGFDILLRARIKASRIQDFNDPFELMFGMKVETAIETIRNEYAENPRILEAWHNVLDDQAIEYDKTSVENALEKIALFQTKDIERVTKEIREGWNDKGVVCLSNSPYIIQMAHYAENHRGIVVGFEETEFVKDRRALVKVDYKDEMVCLPVTGNPQKLGQYEKYFKDVLRRKETKWDYEQEYRLYVDLDEKDSDGNYYLDIPPSSIREIYIGLRSNEMATIVAQSIRQRETCNHLMIYKMAEHKSEYKLEPQQI
jgi:hypothetical protein